MPPIYYGSAPFALKQGSQALSIYNGSTLVSAGVSTVTASLSASVISGPAPLGVFFDATATTSTETASAWRDVLYAFDYGDASSGVYTYGAQQLSKNRNLGGPCGGHVYETPGTYTAHLWAYDGSCYQHKTVTITVQDPDSVYSGTNTICCSTSGDFTGAPAGSSNQTVATFQAAVALLATGKRVLLQRSDAWSSSGVATLTGTINDARIGSFGSGSKATVTKTGLHNFITLNPTSMSNFAMMDLSLNGAGFAAAGVSVYTGKQIAGLTMHNIAHTNASGLIITTGTGRSDNTTIHKAEITAIVGGAGNNGLYLAGANLAVIDSLIDNTTAAEHCLRCAYVGKGFISGLTSTRPATNGKAALTVRAPAYAGGGVVNLPANSYTEFVVVSNCTLSGNTSIISSFSPSSTANDERVRKCVFEANHVIATGVNAAYGCVFQSLDSVSRNNVYNMTGGADYPSAISVTAATLVIPDAIVSYNDTLYIGDATNTTTMFGAGATTTNNVVKNGLVYCPSSTNVTVISGTGVVTASNNTSNANAKTVNPQFVNGSGLLSAYSDFAIGSASPYKAFGASVPVFVDGFGFVRSKSAPDSGALNSSDHAVDFWPSVIGR